MNILANEFKQKKRNRAIRITDIAIDKVPITNIFGLVDIHSWASWLIKGANPREVVIKHNIDAYKMLISGYKNQLMFIHNHPSTGTFSGEDFKMFCYHSSLYIMSVVGNDSTVYILIKTFIRKDESYDEE